MDPGITEQFEIEMDLRFATLNARSLKDMEGKKFEQYWGLADPLFEDPKDSATFVRKVVACAPRAHGGRDGGDADADPPARGASQAKGHMKGQLAAPRGRTKE